MNWNELRCQSERMCIHIVFYVIVVHAIARKEVSALTPQMDLSPRTRVYVRGGRWAGHLLEFRPVRSATNLQIPIKRSLDLFRLMWWISYLGFRYDIVVRQPSAWICHLSNLWKDSEDPGGACLSPSYTSDWLFSESRLLAIIGLPWPMTLAPTNEAIRHETSGKKKNLSVKVKKLTDLLGCHVIGVRIDFYQKA